MSGRRVAAMVDDHDDEEQQEEKEPEAYRNNKRNPSSSSSSSSSSQRAKRDGSSAGAMVVVNNDTAVVEDWPTIAKRLLSIDSDDSSSSSVIPGYGALVSSAITWCTMLNSAALVATTEDDRGASSYTPRMWKEVWRYSIMDESTVMFDFANRAFVDRILGEFVRRKFLYSLFFCATKFSDLGFASNTQLFSVETIHTLIMLYDSTILHDIQGEVIDFVDAVDDILLKQAEKTHGTMDSVSHSEEDVVDAINAFLSKSIKHRGFFDGIIRHEQQRKLRTQVYKEKKIVPDFVHVVEALGTARLLMNMDPSYMEQVAIHLARKQGINEVPLQEETKSRLLAGVGTYARMLFVFFTNLIVTVYVGVGNSHALYKNLMGSTAYLHGTINTLMTPLDSAAFVYLDDNDDNDLKGGRN